MSTRSCSQSRAITAIALSLLALLTGWAGLLLEPAYADAVVGTGTPASCTEAALDAALGTGGLITFDCGAGPVVISLANEKVISLTTTINGGGKIILKGNGMSRLFNVISGVGLTLDNLSLTNGSAPMGGAVFNAGWLTVTNSTLSGNTMGTWGGALYVGSGGHLTVMTSTLSGNSALEGGAIYNQGTMFIHNTTFADNSAGVRGGGFINIGVANITTSTFDGNTSPDGGAIRNIGTLFVAVSTFVSNTASAHGAGIYNDSYATVGSSTFLSNTTSSGLGGAVYNAANLSFSLSTLTGNAASRGGGIYNEPTSVMTLMRSTLSGNSALGGFGGGIYNKGKLTLTADTLAANSAGPGGGQGGGILNDLSGNLAITNSTFSSNLAGFSGGGIQSSGPATVTNSTFFGNDKVGVTKSGASPVMLVNSIVANNAVYNCSGTITSLGHNLETANTCGLTAAGDLPNTNASLGPLANNGGATRTHALLPGSQAINRGDNSQCPPLDQRDATRPRSAANPCDIGAFEATAYLFLPIVAR